VKYRLLIDLEVYDFLAGLTANERRQLRSRFGELAEAPAHWMEVADHDATGRLLWITVCGRFAITFWEDFTDRHIKILRVVLADR
jgi:hypothetical protein